MASRHRRTGSRRLTYEALEDRRLMAADVLHGSFNHLAKQVDYTGPSMEISPPFDVRHIRVGNGGTEIPKSGAQEAFDLSDLSW